jgi:extradiol dioxygenase family protein
MHPFHLAFPVHDLSAARRFYGELLGCPEGRSSEAWIDFDFHGHQIVAHLAPDLCEPGPKSSPEPDPSRSKAERESTSQVDGKSVPVRHFGLVLDMESWGKLAQRLKGKVDFLIEPYIRFVGEPGEQATMFFTDPSGNAIEIKAFADRSRLFAK